MYIYLTLFLSLSLLQVNVSNTWTMPQEGLNVFYRFFRDRISWFEADAVCQFHHANLVTGKRELDKQKEGQTDGEIDSQTERYR